MLKRAGFPKMDVTSEVTIVHEDKISVIRFMQIAAS